MTTIADVLTERAERVTDPVAAAQLVSEIGHALAGGDLGSQAAMRLGRILARQSQHSAAPSYLMAIADLLASVGAGLAYREEIDAQVRAVDADDTWCRIVRELSEAPRTTDSLVGAIGSSPARVSAALLALCGRGLVAVPRVGRLYQLTARGLRIAVLLGGAR